jgi:hypothetical protein
VFCSWWGSWSEACMPFSSAANTESCTQPLHQRIIYSMKSAYRKHLVHFFLQCINRNVPAAAIRKWSTLDAMLSVVISSEYIMLLSRADKQNVVLALSALMKKKSWWNLKVTCIVPGISTRFSMSTN